MWKQHVEYFPMRFRATRSRICYCRVGSQEDLAALAEEIAQVVLTLLARKVMALTAWPVRAVPWALPRA